MPSRAGIALTYHDWAKLEVINKLNEQMPALSAVSPCWHDSQIDEMLCNECTPFSEVDNVDDVKTAEAATSLTGGNNRSSTSTVTADYTTTATPTDFTIRRKKK